MYYIVMYIASEKIIYANEIMVILPSPSCYIMS